MRLAIFCLSILAAGEFVCIVILARALLRYGRAWRAAEEAFSTIGDILGSKYPKESHGR